MISITLSPDLALRFSSFLNSREFLKVHGHAVSQYWIEESSKITISLSGQSLTLDGGAGFYFPPQRAEGQPLRLGLGSLLTKPIKKLLALGSAPRDTLAQEIQMLDFRTSFDLAMGETIDPSSVPFEGIDFSRLRGTKGVVASIRDFEQTFFARQRYGLCFHLIKSQFYLNLLLGYTPLSSTRDVLEIGAGSGNLTSLLFHALRGGRIVVVDLPKVLCFSIPFLTDLFPEAKVILPHEVKDPSDIKADLVFLTPDQIDLIEDDSFDLAVNTESFQEMTHEQISTYFSLMQRTVRHGGNIFISGRVQKYPHSLAQSDAKPERPNRFCDYPWRKENKTILYDLCPFRRLFNLHPSYIRLDQVVKTAPNVTGSGESAP